MKLLSKKLLENGQGYYVAQVGMTQPEAKVLRDLVERELNKQRSQGKAENYQTVKNTAGALHDAFNTLKAAYVKRNDGRWNAKHLPVDSIHEPQSDNPSPSRGLAEVSDLVNKRPEGTPDVQ